mmetsp:Transcript_13231/g.41842  ORF Transcript_13231/g.41842 Transcript_13231/m.41842 type:complete len:87 (-) Transcript_13231:138-398(-)
METEGAQAEVSWPGFEKFNNVQGILDRNKLLINEINHNHDRRSPEGLARNVQLIRELNENIAMVVQMYRDISGIFLSSIIEGQKRP